jgi:hypothetical protein
MSDAGEQRDAKRTDVVCAWCGHLIRRGAAKATKRMCQLCFARMMREHSRAHQRQASLHDASDR